MANLIWLHHDLAAKTYIHSAYQHFKIADPKPRDINKASVRDRLLHHAIHRVLYPYFDRRFVADSYSCRIGKGTHRALDRFRSFFYTVSRNNTRTCWVLKGDVKKFFASIDQAILLRILKRHIDDPDVLWLLGQVIGSFSATRSGIGLPLGNLTSQLLVNVYMNEFDQFVKHRLKAEHYIRYADDFVVLSCDRGSLVRLIAEMQNFLHQQLRLTLHPDKVLTKTFASGVDFLGWVHFPDHRVLRTATKRRMVRRVRAHPAPETVSSYLGLLRHGNTARLRRQVFNGWRD